MVVDAKSLARDLLSRHAKPALEPVRPPGGRGLDDHPEIRAALALRGRATAAFADRGLPNPFFLPHTGVNGATTGMLGGEVVNFSGYNYLGLAGDPRVTSAAKQAIDVYGTSASASRAVAGEIPLYADLERRLAGAYGTGDAVITASGYLTNAGLLPFLLGPGDLAACDALVHSSIVSGTRWAGCRRATFAHNDPDALDRLLVRSRGSFGRVLVVVEGAYSMDGDVARLPELIAVARKHDCLIMVDEAHSFGVLGDQGFGVREHFGLAADTVDLWMGTLSKSLASCGGFLAGDAELIAAIKTLAQGVSLFSAAPTPAQIAAAIAAFDVMVAEPDRLTRLHGNAATMASALRADGWDTGVSAGTAIIPVILGAEDRAMATSGRLLAAGIYAAPLGYPSVAEGAARIRLFMSADHTAEHIDQLVTVLGAG
ncbi:aminotransferase class I/II-fold pyridoxal phosphate-dependent enzyme [Nocardia sp. NPDC051832]|uniref:aminotransferase class I/II-fold pyridoxal phosphate-dependent enzyme n=1 Tax=Nocardia sp. NPDC051832 TaxID=3155673 RepID=UPI0034171507